MAKKRKRVRARGRGKATRRRGKVTFAWQQVSAEERQQPAPLAETIATLEAALASTRVSHAASQVLIAKMGEEVERRIEQATSAARAAVLAETAEREDMRVLHDFVAGVEMAKVPDNVVCSFGLTETITVSMGGLRRVAKAVKNRLAP